ncbi:MAG: sensor domain-containing protein [Chloroflexi bacterium]|nr:sensor domain-containing protein [Chloroflexota bacterium]MCH8223461.1 sensor domain-containing protein [Chloroflexota bacterium]
MAAISRKAVSPDDRKNRNLAEVEIDLMWQGLKSMLGSSLSLVMRWRTYGRMLYLLIGLPLGLFYAVFIFGAIVLGVGLSPIGIGVLLLIGLAMGSWILLAIDRELAVMLIGVELDPLITPRADGLVATARVYFLHPGTWKSLAYLVLRFPLGVITFAIVFVAIGIASTLTAAPITLLLTDLDLGFWKVDETWESFILAPFGPPAGIIALFIIDRVALAYTRVINAAISS